MSLSRSVEFLPFNKKNLVTTKFCFNLYSGMFNMRRPQFLSRRNGQPASIYRNHAHTLSAKTHGTRIGQVSLFHGQNHTHPSSKHRVISASQKIGLHIIVPTCFWVQKNIITKEALNQLIFFFHLCEDTNIFFVIMFFWTQIHLPRYNDMKTKLLGCGNKPVLA